MYFNIKYFRSKRLIKNELNKHKYLFSRLA